MKRLACRTLLVLAFAVAGFAQSAGEMPAIDQILARYLEASGGKTAIEKHTSRVSKGTIEVVTFGSTGTMELYAKAPDKQFSRSEFEGYGQVIQGFDGKTAWIKTPDTGLREMSGAELERARLSADFYLVSHIKQRYSKMAITGRGRAGDRPAYIVDAESAAGPEKVYFDVESGLLVRSEIQTPQGPATISFQDYREIDGVKLPHTIRQESDQLSLVIRIAQVRHDVPIEDVTFAKPAN